MYLYKPSKVVMFKYTKDSIQNILNPKDITLVSELSNIQTKHDLSCDLCNHQWSASLVQYIYKNTSCPNCKFIKNASSKLVTLAVVEERFSKLPITLVSEYTKAANHHDVKCDICENVWSATLYNIFRKRGCPVCHNKNRVGPRLKPAEVKRRLQHLESRFIKLESKSSLVKDLHNFSCMLPNCMFKWTTTFDEVYRETGCPKCAGRHATDKEKIAKKTAKLIRSKLGSKLRDIQRKKEGRLSRSNEPMIKRLDAYWLEECELIPQMPDDGKVYSIDHIIPCSWFDVKNFREMVLCWNHRNIRWLEYRENSRKSARLRPEDIDILTDYHIYIARQASFSQLDKYVSFG